MNTLFHYDLYVQYCIKCASLSPMSSGRMESDLGGRRGTQARDMLSGGTLFLAASRSEYVKFKNCFP